MARVVPTNELWTQSAAAENLSDPQAALASAAAFPIMDGLTNWIPDQIAGADENAFRAAWSELAKLEDSQIRAIMRFVAGLTNSTFLSS